jgi:hypothetical protein
MVNKVYIQPPTDTCEEPGHVGKLTQEAACSLEAEIISFFNLYPAWLTQANSPETLMKYLRAGVWHGWTALSPEGDMEIFGICAWEIHEHDCSYHVLYIGGKNLRTHLREGLQELEKYVYLNGGSGLIFHGRDGWSRLLAPYGYKPMTYLHKNVRKTMGH